VNVSNVQWCPTCPTLGALPYDARLVLGWLAHLQPLVGGMEARHLAIAAGLPRGATYAALMALEAAGMARRTRRAYVLTAAAHALAADCIHTAPKRRIPEGADTGATCPTLSLTEGEPAHELPC
jgi:hypothetical protein